MLINDKQIGICIFNVHHCFDGHLSSYENKMKKKHIAYGSACNRYKHLTFPQMKQYGCGDRYKFRQTVISLKNIDIFQAINHKHAKYSRRQILTDILDKFGSCPVFWKDNEWKEPCEHGSKNTQSDSYYLLGYCHYFTTSVLSSGLRSTAKRKIIAAIVGIINESAPNMNRQMAEAPRPIYAEICRFSFSHCSRKMTTNIAVITKLMPSVLKRRREPIWNQQD